MSDHVFLVTSAINTKFGIYSANQRLEQTLSTIASIRSRVTDAKIVIMELAGQPLAQEQLKQLTQSSDHLMDFTNDPSVVGLYTSSDNWDVVKNVTEVMCFAKALKTLKEIEFFEFSRRIFKVSGRYVLNDVFDINLYNQYSTQPYIVIGQEKPSQFPYQVTQIERQYMARLWSWPVELLDEVISVYDRSLVYMWERLQAGGYADIEHVLYKFLDPKKLMNLPELGIEGNIAPNGVAIKN